MKKAISFPVIEREPRASFLTFADGSSIVSRADGKCYPSMPYPPSRGWHPGIQAESLEAYKFFAEKGKDHVLKILNGGVQMKPDC